MKKEVCHWCARKMNPVEVHGHHHCPHCKGAIDECCSGEQAQGFAEDEEKKTNDEH